MNTDRPYDVVIVGGGAAGLSAATALARCLRRVLVVDAGEPRNALAHRAHDVLGQDGVSPRELLAAGRREAHSYGAQVVDSRAVTARRHEDALEVDLAGGGTVRGRRLLLATGLVDELPDVPGVRELWGSSVLHCPYCHGWEVRGQRIGVLATGALSVHQALLFRQLSEYVTVFAHHACELPADALEQFAALDVTVVPGAVNRLRIDGGALAAVVLAGGSQVDVDALAVAPFLAHADLYVQLGGTLTEHPAGQFIATGPMGRTPIAGVWAAGNTSDLGATVTAASAAGIATATGINADLVADDAATAVRTARRPAADAPAG